MHISKDSWQLFARNILFLGLSLFCASYAAAWLSWMGFGILDQGSKFFEPSIGWGTRKSWYKNVSDFASFGQALASPGLVIYLGLTLFLFKTGKDSFAYIVSTALCLALFNGLLFIALWKGQITVIFLVAGLITGVLHWLIMNIFKLLKLISSDNRAALSLQDTEIVEK